MTFLAGLQVLFLLIALLYAWWKGGWPERVGALILIAMLVIDRAWHAIFGMSSFLGLDQFHLALDGVAFLACFALALVANRNWPLCFAALQLLSTTGHVLMVIKVMMPPPVYGMLIVAPSYGMIATLLTGIACRHWRLRKERSTGSSDVG
ncbi:MAG: hypothetical protein K5799_03975 [Erythrobacter sp.]|nr:hypothetical protein [Erythrobacter sp.]